MKLKRESKEYLSLAIGLALPILPLFDGNLLLVIVGVYSLFLLPGANLRNLLPFLPLCFFLIGSVITESILTDPVTWKGVLAPLSGGYLPLAYNKELLWGGPSWAFTLQSAVQWCIASLFYAVLVSHPKYSLQMISGIKWGMLVAVVCLALQITGVVNSALFEQDFFWTAQKRWSATFTDPNAFGVGVFLAIALLITPKVISSANLLVLLLLLAGLFSGSRALVLGVIALIFVLLLHTNARFIKGAILLIIGVMLLNVVHLVYPLHSSNWLSTLPSSIGRVTDTLLIDRYWQALASRKIFWDIATQMWLSDPWSGLGVAKFRTYLLPYTHLAGYDLGQWSDNANSFYLGALVELGIYGTLCLAYAFWALKFQPESTSIRRGALLIFLALLILGPHLEFLEVHMLFMVLLATTVVPRELGCIPNTFYLVPLLLGIVVTQNNEYGWYPWERDGDRIFRWSSIQSRGSINCHHDRAELLLRSLMPNDQGVAHQQVEIWRFGRREKVVELRYGEQISLNWECVGSNSVNYDIRVDPSWRPIQFGAADPRMLGVQEFRAIAR